MGAAICCFHRSHLLTYGLASVDEHAFKRVPEVGTTPDMISDDLPSNLDYLDESFGAAAGLRELRDDDLDEFDIEETEISVTTSPTGQQTGIISKIGGETIKILYPDGIHIVENHFDTLQPDSPEGDNK
jgi:autophagy-related protein 2